MNEVVVVTRNSADHIGPCIDSIVAEGGLPIIVDNDSEDDTLQIARSKEPKVRVIALRENLGYGKALNLGFRETKGEFVILSNPDVVFLPNSIRKMIEFLREKKQVGITGPQQMFPDRSWQASYGDLPGIWSGIKDVVGIATMRNVLRRMLWPRRLDRRPKEVPYVDGGVLAVRREAFEGIKGFDEDFFMYSDESDLCARLGKAGWGVVFLPSAEVIHVRGASVAKEEQAERFIRCMVKSQFLLADKHLPPWKVRVYTKLQVYRFIRLGLTHRLMRRLVGSSFSNSQKIWVLDTYTRIWKEASVPPPSVHTLPADPKPSDVEEHVKVN